MQAVIEDKAAGRELGQQTAEAAAPQPKELRGLRFIRLVAAYHIVALHFFAGLGCRWGISWLSFFFLLSGFGAAYSKLQRAEPATFLPQPKTLLRRLASIYPTYAVAFVAAVAGHLVRGRSIIHWRFLLAEALLLHEVARPQRDVVRAGAIYGPESGSLFNIPGWYCGALMICWLLEEPCFTVSLWLRKCGALGFLGAAAAVTAWLLLTSPVYFMYEYWYLGVYAFGALMPHYLPQGAWAQSPVGRCIASLAALGIVVVFTLVDATRPPPSLPGSRAWCLMPLQVALIYGLAMGSDPLAQFFSMWPLPDLSELSLGVYLFQSPVCNNLLWLNSWARADPSAVHTTTCLVATTAVAAVVHFCVQRPVERLLRGK